MSEPSFPKIGQSLGESETLYASGYLTVLPQSNTPIMICDCPGFADTRGSDYEICTNLSIDKAIDKAKTIRAIVLTVPIHAFYI